jgi:hypothetical protein
MWLPFLLSRPGANAPFFSRSLKVKSWGCHETFFLADYKSGGSRSAWWRSFKISRADLGQIPPLTISTLAARGKEAGVAAFRAPWPSW